MEFTSIEGTEHSMFDLNRRNASQYFSWRFYSNEVNIEKNKFLWERYGESILFASGSFIFIFFPFQFMIFS